MANYISTHTGAEIDAAVDAIGDINTILEEVLDGEQHDSNES